MNWKKRLLADMENSASNGEPLYPACVLSEEMYESYVASSEWLCNLSEAEGVYFLLLVIEAEGGV